MTGAPAISLDITPTERGVAYRPGDFPTLTAALDHAAAGRSGFNYYNAKGEPVEVVPYPAMRADARRVAAQYAETGLKPGDRIAILAETGGDFARAFMGALYAGMIPAPMPLPVAFGDRAAYVGQIQRIMTVAGASAAIGSNEYASWLAEAAAPLGLLYTGALADLPPAEAAVADRPLDVEDIAYLQFSSGTTGAPKGVAVTHRAMMANLNGIAEHGLGLNGSDRGVAWLPLYHDMGLVGCFFTPIATQMSADHFSTRDFVRRPLLWMRLMSENKCSITYAPSFGYDLALRRAKGKSVEEFDLSHWRAAGIGGDMIKAPVLRQFAEVFAPAKFDPGAFVPSYGMAETTLALSFAPVGQGLRAARLDLDRLEREMKAAPPTKDAPARDFALCGPPLPDHKIEVRREDGSEAGQGEVGRIFAYGPSLMKEYFGDPAATAAALKDGWLDTGDLGYFEDGQIVITGRAKDLIIVNGRNLWPQDLEWTVEGRVDAIRDGGAAAFSVTPDDQSDRLEEAVVVVVECRARDDDAREAIRGEVHAVVREVHGVEVEVALAKNGDLPQTSSGKLSRIRARAMYREGAFDTGRA